VSAQVQAGQPLDVSFALHNDSMRARFSVSVQRERGFWVAQALVVTPSGRNGVRVR
jgi:hypothetical protein